MNAQLAESVAEGALGALCPTVTEIRPMIVDLKTLKPNPYRDFTVDPIDEDNVVKLAESIREDGFWGGVVCRKTRDGQTQIAAGHHRIKAAMKAGIKTADLFCGNLDDAAMIRVYARENATQRGNGSTAVAGTVASAIRFLAKAVMTGVSGDFTSKSGRPVLAEDIGRDVIVRFLRGIPGVTDESTKQQLANLKASGDYARIIGEVRDEIEAENKEAMKAAEAAEKARQKAEEEARKAEEARREASARAKVAKDAAEKARAEAAHKNLEAAARLAATRRLAAEREAAKFDAQRKAVQTARKAADKAAEREVTFDFEGVAKHLKNENQVRVFREFCTGQGVRPYLSVNQQAALAKRLVDLATERDSELSGAFIKNEAMTLLLNAKTAQRELSRKERDDLARKNYELQARNLQEEFARQCRSIMSIGQKLAELEKKFPKDLAFPITGEFRNAVSGAKKVIDSLTKRI
jgi:hypothetical protein